MDGGQGRGELFAVEVHGGVSGKPGPGFFGRSGAFRDRDGLLDFDMRHHRG
jgi:hypothetical protein